MPLRVEDQWGTFLIGLLGGIKRERVGNSLGMVGVQRMVKIILNLLLSGLYLDLNIRSEAIHIFKLNQITR